MRPLIVLVLLAVSVPCHAYKRARQPFNVALMQADTIISAEVSAPTLDPVRTWDLYRMPYALRETLKGTPKDAPNPVSLHFWYTADIGKIEDGDRLLLFFEKGRLLMDGTGQETSVLRQRVEEGLRRLPAWSKPQDGFVVAVVPEQFRQPVTEELNLTFLVKNVSDTTRTLRYHNLPLGGQTHWKLKVTDSGGKVIEPIPHPHLDAAAMKKFEQTQGREWEAVLAPEQTQTYRIPRVYTAQAGWGYKEELDFKYYPMTKGRYKIGAVAHNLGEIELKTLPVEVELE